MTNPSIAENNPPRRSRARRREAMINAIATVLGCMALVVMIATVARVVMVKLWESARVNPDYVQSVYDHEMNRRWSGNVKGQPSLLKEESSAKSEPAPGKKIETTVVPANIAANTPPSVIPVAIQDIESKRTQIEIAVRGFFEAANLESKLAFARDALRVRPLMERYYSSRPPTPLEWRSLGWVLPVEEPGYRLGYAQAVFANAEPVSLIIEELDDGSFRVDWESSVRYGELDWDEFIESRPTAPKLFRVIASKPLNPPSGDSPQDEEVLELKHPDQSDTIFAWFDRSDPKFQPLIQQLRTGNWKDVPLTLRLCYPGSATGGKNARIADVEGKGWLILQGTRS